MCSFIVLMPSYTGPIKQWPQFIQISLKFYLLSDSADTVKTTTKIKDKKVSQITY